MTDVTLEMVWVASQTTRTELLRVEGGVVVVRNEYAHSGESRYRLRDGRSVDENDQPTAWNLWRLSARDRQRIRARAVAVGIDNGG